MSRPNLINYFMDIAKLVATRSTCTRRQVGAIIVKNKHIISTGYNGAPSNLPHCTDGKCMREQQDIPSGERYEMCNAVHAEMNAVVQAAKLGASVDGAFMVCTHYPCVMCARIIVNAGIKHIYYDCKSVDNKSVEILKKGYITTHKVKQGK